MYRPDILVCRTEHHIPQEVRTKVARFCNVKLESVIENANASTIYEVPFLLRKENLDVVALKHLGLPVNEEPDLSYWKNFVARLKNPNDVVQIGLVGKYVELHDSYLSISESLSIAGAENELQVDISWIHSEDITAENQKRLLGHLDGIIVAPGFGERGVDGKILSVKFARENKIPFLGICLGMQMAIVEFGRNVLQLQEANSTEFAADTKHPVINMMEEQKKVKQLGGTMRLGGYACSLKRNSLSHMAYQKTQIRERHRHRYEFNNAYREQYEKKGVVMSGINPETELVEIIELKGHPFFIGTQFHPEYSSTVENPHPIFLSFINAAFSHHTEKTNHKEEERIL